MNKKHKETFRLKKNKTAAIIIALIIIVLILTVVCAFIVPKISSEIRRNRIVEIYNSLNIDNNKYIKMSESIFGEKRLYEWDSGRSYSSSIRYVRGANVDVTVAELQKAITGAGYKYFEQPYPNEYHYKSSKNEYIRLNVSSKLRDDAFFNNYHMGLSTDNINIDSNAGPSNVTIKVNLDDNNE